MKTQKHHKNQKEDDQEKYIHYGSKMIIGFILWRVWPPDVKSWLIGKAPDAGKDWGQEDKGTTEDEMVGWRHWLNGDEFE